MDTHTQSDCFSSSKWSTKLDFSIFINILLILKDYETDMRQLDDNILRFRNNFDIIKYVTYFERHQRDKIASHIDTRVLII